MKRTDGACNSHRIYAVPSHPVVGITHERFVLIIDSRGFSLLYNGIRLVGI